MHLLRWSLPGHQLNNLQSEAYIQMPVSASIIVHHDAPAVVVRSPVPAVSLHGTQFSC